MGLGVSDSLPLPAIEWQNNGGEEKKNEETVGSITNGIWNGMLCG